METSPPCELKGFSSPTLHTPSKTLQRLLLADLFPSISSPDRLGKVRQDGSEDKTFHVRAWVPLRNLPWKKWQVSRKLSAFCRVQSTHITRNLKTNKVNEWMPGNLSPWESSWLSYIFPPEACSDTCFIFSAQGLKFCFLETEVKDCLFLAPENWASCQEHRQQI